ncbi:MAG: hypothetical protein OEY20_11285 [Gemmatimonadota bacterium]|nr:hypothetical protein [Gemmatimonadota bacterium]MDH4351492.1 hypothetical protein [Gemmatimonadota bacterium]MDH5197823.1 hypothetical protein [Gemmatimonadota bacterium]
MTEPVQEATPPAQPAESGAVGFGWRRVAVAVAERIPVGEIERIWLFPPVRQEAREWGTAVVARRMGPGRLHVYTGSYGLVVRGRERGQGQVAVEDVGETPDAVLPDVIRGVQERARETDYPDEIAPSAWYPSRDEPSPAG